MGNIASTHTSIKPRRTAQIITAAKDFLDARWHLAEARGALAQAQAAPVEERAAMQRQRVCIYADTALKKLEAAEEAAPGLRRRCAAELAKLEELVAQAGSPVSAAPVAKVVDMAAVRARRAAVR